MAKIKYWDAQSQSYKQSQGVSSLNGMVGDVASPYFTNPNLLDNAWFQINQRGASTYSTSQSNQAPFTYDRWQISTPWGWIDASATFGTSNLTFSVAENTLYPTSYSQFVQTLEKPLEQNTDYTLTFYVESTSGSGFKRVCLATSKSVESGEFVDIVDGLNTITFNTGNVNLQCLVFRLLNNNSITLSKKIKLEKGTKSTLQFDIAPDYATELLRCQRYFWNAKGYQNMTIGCGYCELATRALIDISLPCEMRSNPTILQSGLQIHTGYGIATVTSIPAARNASNQYQMLCETTTSMQRYSPCVLGFVNSSSYLQLSADL